MQSANLLLGERDRQQGVAVHAQSGPPPQPGQVTIAQQALPGVSGAVVAGGPGNNAVKESRLPVPVTS